MTAIEAKGCLVSKSIHLWQVHFADGSPMSETAGPFGDKENGKCIF